MSEERKFEKPDWMIHYVQEHDCQLCGYHSDEPAGFPYFANVHTHGLNIHGHDELCIPLDIGPKVAGGLLNELGLRIRENHMKFEEGENTSVLANGMRVKFYRSNGSETLYLLLPDPKGILPEEDGCSKPYCYQKIYADIIEEDER